MVNVTFVRLSDTAILPKKAYPTDAGFDLFADLAEINLIPSGSVLLIPIGFAIEFPKVDNLEYFFEAQIRSKSGLALNEQLIVLNSPGTIDMDYTGEIKVILFNTSKETKYIRPKQKIAQLVFNIVPFVNIKEGLQSLENKGGRQKNGFGSTGI